ncbi:MAG: hypothetical protein EOO05_14915 [Chitinophagaceae bacterium]|nr:MAG: hypothetical protein EOO05_14915 [Chitinophagaceae bacterium]
MIDGELRQVRIRLECASGEVWGDPDTSERAEIKDWEERTWRHLDYFADAHLLGQLTAGGPPAVGSCQFETIIMAKVPRLLLKSGAR